jgi:dTDP-4-dehydrorhamnose reductase
VQFWASPEPTIARITADQYRDQRIETGHYARLDDIDRLATLGIAATRYPVLWESVAPCEPQSRSYEWEDERMRRLARFGIEPIVTLLHHGSGPPYTSLIDDAFPELFADYAEATARRYSHVRRWTPINEPLTTARFSTLYGAWYPNARSDRAFGAAIVNQTLAYLLAVERIRRVRPDAEFMVTEDLQSFVATDSRSRAYADHKRERSYLSIDLVRGAVAPGHPLWTYLTETCSIAVATLERVRRLARPPDLLGWNYYPNSERYLQTQSDGTIGNIPLLDALPVALDPKPMLREAWRRFGIPLALSEVHVMGTHAERARWLLQRYDDAQTLRAERVDVRAFGAWAAFGMVDWSSLLCERRACLEDGLFTCEPDGTREPELTLAGETFRQLAAGTVPALAHAGWWERRHSA